MYFTIDELRALPDMDDLYKFPDDRLEAAHDWIVAVIERVCDTTFVLDTVVETASGACREFLTLSTPYVRTVTNVVVDGQTVDPATVVVENGLVYLKSGLVWSGVSRGNVTITYMAGYSDEVPSDLKEAALRGARNWALTMHSWSGVDERQTSQSTDFGVISMSTASVDDRPTGWPMIDTVIMSWARRVRVPKVA